MLKTVLAGTTALAIAGASLAYAQKAPDARDHAQRWRPNAADMTAFGDARIAALHAGLKLTPEQEKNWPAVESALRDVAKQRSDWFTARASANRPADPLERLGARAKVMQERGAALGKLATAAGPLYGSLDDAQKHRFMVLARLNNHEFGNRHGRHHGHGHDGVRPGGMRQGGPADGGPQPQ
ncbi:MAG: Spy/CpxP family protein refolding chaperone [Bryobacteraceae bacterium]